MPVKRVITCQGSIQLITALSVLRRRDQAQHCESIEYENYLVIYDLYAPVGQNDEFAQFIQEMARSLCAWKAIVYLTPDQMQSIAQQMKHSSPKKLFEIVQGLVGTESAAEIYLSRNWQFGNQLLINAYSSATKICYGDSIGLYFSESSVVVAPTKIEPDSTRKTLQEGITDFKAALRLRAAIALCNLQVRLNRRTLLETVAFDVGYFTLPDVFDEDPPMPIVHLNQQMLLETMWQLQRLVDPEYITRFQQVIAGVPVYLLLTSNFSEAGRISEADEITAYRQMLVSEGIAPNTVLVVKPHPRDSADKIQSIQQSLSDLFQQIVVLSEPSLFFLPFEVFFLAAFSQSSCTEIKTFTVSSACLALKLLFGIHSKVGFGEEISSTRFNLQYRSGRLKHEQQLEAAIQKIGHLSSDSVSSTVIPQTTLSA